MYILCVDWLISYEGGVLMIEEKEDGNGYSLCFDNGKRFKFISYRTREEAQSVFLEIVEAAARGDKFIEITE